jgi:hypothetical protein
MSESAQQSNPPAPQKPPLRLRVFYFLADPLIGLIVLMVAVLTAIVGAVAGESSWILCGIVLAISAIGLLALVLLMALETLNGRAQKIIGNVAAMYDAGDLGPSNNLKLGSLFKN